MFPDAWAFGWSRSTRMTSTPSRASSRAVAIPTIPAPTIATLASVAVRAASPAAALRTVRGAGASPWSSWLHSGFSRARAKAGTGFTGNRGAKSRNGSGVSPRASAHQAATRDPQ